LSEDNEVIPLKPAAAVATPGGPVTGYASSIKTINDTLRHFMKDAPTCAECGHITVRNGACFKCVNCGASAGCS
jgi:ribonucleoside-diphosphate reductase alpha chain